MNKITITITNCSDCPHIRYTRLKSHAYCDESGELLFFLSDDISDTIPDSCPLLAQNESDFQTKEDARKNSSVAYAGTS